MNNEETVYRQYKDILNQVCREGGNIPHCDSNILHRADLCVYCDLKDYQKLHEARLILGINHTGEYAENLLICPAEQKRNLPVIEKWNNNRAVLGTELPPQFK